MKSNVLCINYELIKNTFINYKSIETETINHDIKEIRNNFVKLMKKSTNWNQKIAILYQFYLCINISKLIINQDRTLNDCFIINIKEMSSWIGKIMFQFNSQQQKEYNNENYINNENQYCLYKHLLSLNNDNFYLKYELNKESNEHCWYLQRKKCPNWMKHVGFRYKNNDISTLSMSDEFKKIINIKDQGKSELILDSKIKSEKHIFEIYLYIFTLLPFYSDNVCVSKQENTKSPLSILNVKSFIINIYIYIWI